MNLLFWVLRFNVNLFHWQSPVIKLLAVALVVAVIALIIDAIR
jgi:hypothetical protein